MMPPHLRLLPGALADLFAEASSSSKITLADRYGLLAALLEDSLTEEERASIDRILYSLHRGRLKVVSEISALSWQSPESSWLVPSQWANDGIDCVSQWQKPSGAQVPAQFLNRSADQCLENSHSRGELVKHL